MAKTKTAVAVKKPGRNSRPAKKMIYYFGRLRCDGRGDQKHILGGKGANLAEMTSIGLPVPPGFTITVECCEQYYKNGRKLPAGLMDDVHKHVALLEKETGKKFGHPTNPLLVSVRSGAARSMPGMMETILNLGLTDESVVGLANATGNERFAYDAYRRLINMFGSVVMDLDHKLFEHQFKEVKEEYGAKVDTEVPTAGLTKLCDLYKQMYHRNVGQAFPQNPYKQLELAITAVFNSWMAPKAVSYRQIENITDLAGTAVNVQSMVFGNMGDDSGTGVAFTRSPATGENRFYGEYLVNAQGEDVVAGIRTPLPVSQMPQWNKHVYAELLEIRDKLEQHYKDVQDIEFTIERGKLYMLQTRAGKRTGAAAVKIACDMVREGLIDERHALLLIPAADLTQVLLPSFDASAKKTATILTRGLPASPGAEFGTLAFTAEDAVDRAHKGERVLLVRAETSPEDVDGMHVAAGILTSTGGMTSHAAVVARGWGRCCVVGASQLHIDEEKRTVTIGDRTFTQSDVLSIDGSTGEVLLGPIARRDPKPTKDFKQIMEWADKYRKLRVRTNADTPEDAQKGRENGAEGIGLCRTEHMFFDPQRIQAMREMILAADEPARRRALDKLLPYQREDFIGIFKAMQGLPVTVRLLDPPLHEFLPHEEKQQIELAQMLGVPLETVQARVHQLKEFNPMLGTRGCRLCMIYPEILQMQVRAIVEATITCRKKRIDARPEIMHPLVGIDKELDFLRALTEQTIAQVRTEMKFTGEIEIPIGTMIEVPRAALTADAIARAAEFFSFGTNDLTQMTFGFSRDDTGTLVQEYKRKKILPDDPFESLDTGGVGQLIQMAVTKGRTARKGLKCGICGEHGGDPASVAFCHKVGLDYVSCSPFRVPIARLAAAQAVIRERR
jgi:pyruvate,orthophosphate dikinase